MDTLQILLAGGTIGVCLMAFVFYVFYARPSERKLTIDDVVKLLASVAPRRDNGAASAAGAVKSDFDTMRAELEAQLRAEKQQQEQEGQYMVCREEHLQAIGKWIQTTDALLLGGDGRYYFSILLVDGTHLMVTLSSGIVINIDKRVFDKANIASVCTCTIRSATGNPVMVHDLAKIPAEEFLRFLRESLVAMPASATRHAEIPAYIESLVKAHPALGDVPPLYIDATVSDLLRRNFRLSLASAIAGNPTVRASPDGSAIVIMHMDRIDPTKSGFIAYLGSADLPIVLEFVDAAFEVSFTMTHDGVVVDDYRMIDLGSAYEGYDVEDDPELDDNTEDTAQTEAPVDDLDLDEQPGATSGDNNDATT